MQAGLLLVDPLTHGLGPRAPRSSDHVAIGRGVLAFALVGLPLALLVGAPWGVIVAVSALGLLGAAFSLTPGEDDGMTGSWLLSGELADLWITDDVTRMDGRSEDERAGG